MRFSPNGSPMIPVSLYQRLFGNLAGVLASGVQNQLKNIENFSYPAVQRIYSNVVIGFRRGPETENEHYL